MQEKMTFDELHAGTVPAVLRADGSSWRLWVRKGTVYCKWIEGAVPGQTPFKVPLAAIEKTFDLDVGQLRSLA